MNDPSPNNEPYPAGAAATRTHHQPPFTIAARKLPILKAGPIDALSARLGIPVPEMIFGDNLVSVAHPRTGWRVSFGAEAALDTVDKTGEAGMLRVAHAREWSSSREKTSAGISEVVRPFDWSYSCAYRGDEVPGRGGEKLAAAGGGKGAEGAEGTEGIPVELLKRRDPILFADEVVLYESELDDNGISLLSVKVRVMEQRMLLLCRLFMRLDNVLVRVRDTRVYVDFGREVVVREYTAREDMFENVKRVGALSSRRMPGRCRSANGVVESLHDWIDAGRHYRGAKRLQSGCQLVAGGRALARERLLSAAVVGQALSYLSPHAGQDRNNRLASVLGMPDPPIRSQAHGGIW